jgi:hypothetical protein
VTADLRNCEQCGTSFVPRREHARFCCAPCRAAWNGEHMGDPGTGECALQWAVTAMAETSGRLPQLPAWDLQRALAVISESVWWVTMVDATLVRHHPRTYESVLAAKTLTQRQLTEGTLTGLRYVRNQIGGHADLAEFTGPGHCGAAAAQGPLTGWTWKPAPEPVLASLPPRRQAWETMRYQAYRAHLADRTIGETFSLTAAFLKLTAANAAQIADTTVTPALATCDSCSYLFSAGRP